jgi:flagellar biosynthesis protein FlhG
MKVISFSSGKGGVGKTSLVANLGTLYAKMGRRVLLIDGDWTLGKLSITLGVKPRWTVEQVLTGEIALSNAIHSVSENLSVLASPTGVVGLEELDESRRNQLFFEIEGIGESYDLVLIDHSSGVNWGVLQFAAAAHKQVIVTTPEPTAYTDAYAIIKLLRKRFAIRDFSLLVTFSDNRTETAAILERFSDVVYGNLDVRLRLLDILPWEPRLAESIRRQQPFVERFPGAPLTAKLKQVCGSLDRAPVAETHGLRFSFNESQPKRDTCQPPE